MRPPTLAGTDVYAGCNASYTGNDVSAANFLAVLTGNASSVPPGKPVLRSGPHDEVFVYFADHGASGFVVMPTGDFVYASDLLAALQTMHNTRMFRKLTFYMEACESGSMFDGVLPGNISVYATTAANAFESSWGTYCPPDDVVNGTEIGSCLGDTYSCVALPPPPPPAPAPAPAPAPGAGAARRQVHVRRPDFTLAASTALPSVQRQLAGERRRGAGGGRQRDAAPAVHRRCQ